MNLPRTGLKTLDLSLDARDELYLMIDKHYRPMPNRPETDLSSIILDSISRIDHGLDIVLIFSSN